MKLRNYQRVRQMVLEMVRPDATPEHVAKVIRGIGPDLLHWSDLLNISYENNALPLLYSALSRLGQDTAIPEQVREILLEFYRKNTRRTFTYQNELIKILTAFSREGIPLLPLKGAVALIEDICRDKNIRIMVDLDLLVRKGDYEAAQKVLHGLQYYTEDNFWKVKDKVTFLKSDLKVVELHFLPLGEHFAHYLPVEEVWSRALKKEKYGITFLLPSPTDQLYHLLVHEIIQHQRVINCRILSMYEVYSLLAFYREEIDYDVLFQRARMFNGEGLFSLYLTLTEKKMGPILPPSVKDAIKSRAGKSFIWYEKVSRNPPTLNWASNRFYLILSTSKGFKNYVANAYRILIRESIFLKSDQFILSLYGLTKLPAFLTGLLKWFHVARVLSLHLLVTLLFSLRPTQHADTLYEP